MYDMSVGTYTLILDTLVGVIVVRKLGATDGMSLGICERTNMGFLITLIACYWCSWNMSTVWTIA